MFDSAAAGRYDGPQRVDLRGLKEHDWERALLLGAGLLGQPRSVLLLAVSARTTVERQSSESVFNEQTASADVGGVKVLQTLRLPAPNAAELCRSLQTNRHLASDTYVR